MRKAWHFVALLHLIVAFAAIANTSAAQFSIADLPGVVSTTPGTGQATVPPHERAALTADVTDLVSGNSQFGLNIYQQLSAAASPTDNILVSPFSISAALSMTYAGARGATAQQMASALKFNLPDDRLHSAFGALLNDLTAPRDGYELNIANRLFGQAGYPIHQAFLNTTAENYNAPLEPTDFIGNSEGSRQHINDWVADQTHDKIKDLLPAGSVTSDTRLVLTNAMYFNGDWKHTFDKDATYADSFFGPGGASSQVSMMHQQQSFGYTERPGFQMLEMPYAGDDLSMVVVLPTAHDGLASVEASLTPEVLADSLASLQTESVNVAFPKFTFDSKFGLGATLAAMGMTDAFNSLANFSGIADDDLQISDVIHQTFIAVDEEGTEAAAATGVVVGVTNAVFNPPPPKIFDADHPFLFALRDIHTGSILFLGRVADPGKLVASAAVPEPALTASLLAMALAFAHVRRREFSSRRTD